MIKAISYINYRILIIILLIYMSFSLSAELSPLYASALGNSTYMLYSQIFDRSIFWPSSGVCRTRQSPRHYEPNSLFNQLSYIDLNR